MRFESDPAFMLIKRRVARIGVLRLWYRHEQKEWWVTLDNRTYHGEHKIALDKLPRWRKELGFPP